MTMHPCNDPTSSLLDSRLPQAIHETAMRIVTAAQETAFQLHAEWDHAHLHMRSTQRFSEDGELVSYDFDVRFMLCPSWMCGAPDDGGVSTWSQWLVGKDSEMLAGLTVRSDEAMAAAAIQSVMPTAQVKKLKEGQNGGFDFLVNLPDQSRAAVEVTMHTDSGRRRLSNARGDQPSAALKHDWQLLIRDQRFPSDYGPEHSFPLNEVREIVTAVLARIEEEGADLEQVAETEQRCEQEIDRQWRWPRGRQLKDTPALGVTVVSRKPSLSGVGRLDLQAATAVNHFSKVTETAAVASAAQECIDHKVAKDQWGDTSDPKWLVVVLDEGEAATQLRGVEEFADEDLDFSGITFPGLDEVWVVAFDEGKFTVLRCSSGEPRWRLYRGLEVVVDSDTT